MAWHTRDTVDLLEAASAPSASASVFSTSRVDSPRTNPAITSDSNALDLVTVLPNSWGSERLGGATQLRPRHRHRPGRGLDRHLAIAVAATRPSVRAVSDPLTPGPAEKHLDLGLGRSLDYQPGPEAGNLLDDLPDLTRSVEQGVNLATDPVSGRYSC